MAANPSQLVVDSSPAARAGREEGGGKMEQQLVASLSPSERASLAQLAASSDRSAFIAWLKNCGITKMGSRLRVEMLLKQQLFTVAGNDTRSKRPKTIST